MPIAPDLDWDHAHAMHGLLPSAWSDDARSLDLSYRGSPGPGVEGMSDARRHTPTYYREKAREITSLAWRSRSVEVRLELFEIAELFERIADRVEGRLRGAAD